MIGTPSELVFTGDNVSYQACYSKDETITTITLLTPNNDGRGRPTVEPDYDPSNSSPLQQNYSQQKSTITPNATTTAATIKNTTSTEVTGTPKQQLMELDGLRKEGLISEADYQKQRKSIIEAM